MANDPRWPEHRRKLAAVQVARRFTLFPEEVQQVLDMRAQGRTLRDIADELEVATSVLRRGMRENGISTAAASRKIILSPGQIRAIQRLRKAGRALEDIAEQMSLSRQTVARELRARGVDTKRIRTERDAYRRGNAWQAVLDLDGGRAAWA